MLSPDDQKVVQALKRLTRKIAEGRRISCAIFIAHPEDIDDKGRMGITRLIRFGDEAEARTLLSAIDTTLQGFRPKEPPKEG